MNRLTARVLLVLLLVSIFAPAAMAVGAPLPHACCMRKPMHHHGSGREMQAVGGPHGNCCPPVTTAHWAEPGSGIDSSVYPLLAYLPPHAHPLGRGNQTTALQPVRGPPLS